MRVTPEVSDGVDLVLGNVETEILGLGEGVAGLVRTQVWVQEVIGFGGRTEAVVVGLPECLASRPKVMTGLWQTADCVPPRRNGSLSAAVWGGADI